MASQLSEARFFSVEARNGLYRQQAEYERVIADSKIATFCFELADIVLQGVDLYESINSLDEDWRMMVYKRECDYNESLANRILNLYRGWLETSASVVTLYDSFAIEYAARGFDGDRAAQLKKAVREVRSILTEDDKVFVHSELVELRDAAIDEHRSGQSVEV